MYQKKKKEGRELCYFTFFSIVLVQSTKKDIKKSLLSGEVFRIYLWKLVDNKILPSQLNLKANILNLHINNNLTIFTMIEQVYVFLNSALNT